VESVTSFAIGKLFKALLATFLDEPSEAVRT
jgi:hypothetical protein